MQESKKHLKAGIVSDRPLRRFRRGLLDAGDGREIALRGGPHGDG
jgi:hypothetical protein